MFKKVEDCEASYDEQEKVMLDMVEEDENIDSQSCERVLEVCKKSAELYENVVIYKYSNNVNNKNSEETKKSIIRSSLSLLLLNRVKITLPPATNPPSKLFSINSLCTLILKFIFDMLFYHQLNFKIFFEQLFVVKSIAQLLPPPQPPPISNVIQFHQYTIPISNNINFNKK
jgi:hypothetical protein